MFIQFGLINYKFIIQLLYPLFYHLRFRIGGNRNNCFQLFLNYSSYSLAGVIYLIAKYRTKETKIDNKKNKVSGNKDEKHSNIPDDFENDTFWRKLQEEKKKHEKIELNRLKTSVVGLSILNFLPMFLETIVLNIPSLNFNSDIKESSTIFLEILFYVLFSRIILQQKIYNHQIFSLSIILFCMIFVFIIYLIENSLGFSNVFKNIGFFSLIFFCYCLYNTFMKKILDHFIISPYYLMFSIGFLSLIALLIYEIITCIFLGVNWEYNGIIRQIINDFSFVFILSSIFSIIMGLFWLGGIVLTIYYLSPSHFIINEILTQFVTNLLDNRFGKYGIMGKMICYLAYVIILVSTLIYNEIIIFNIDYISKDTRKNIIKRQNIEIDSLMYGDFDQNIEINMIEDQNEINL